MKRIFTRSDFTDNGITESLSPFFPPRGLIPSSSLNNSKKNILSKIIEIHIPNKITHYNGNIKEKRSTEKNIKFEKYISSTITYKYYQIQTKDFPYSFLPLRVISKYPKSTNECKHEFETFFHLTSNDNNSVFWVEDRTDRFAIIHFQTDRGVKSTIIDPTTSIGPGSRGIVDSVPVSRNEKFPVRSGVWNANSTGLKSWQHGR